MVIRPLNKELQKKAECELNEDSDRLEEDLEHIRKWAQKESHLTIRTGQKEFNCLANIIVFTLEEEGKKCYEKRKQLYDQWLVAFLRGCKFSLQHTKEKLDYFYTMRTLVPEFFANRDPLSPEIQEVLKVGALLPFPKPTEAAGPRIFHVRADVCDPDKISAVTLMKVTLMILDILLLEDDYCNVSGIAIWTDYTKCSLTYMLQYTPSFLKKCSLCIQSAYPLRIKGLYFTNAPSIFESIFKLVRTLMSEKLRTRMKLYSEANVDKFCKNDIPQSLLTKRYGGEIDSLDELTSQWKQKIESYRDWFLEDSKYCSNEALRQGKPKTYADVFGVEGSFRKLAID